MIELTAIFETERHRFENSDGDTIIGTARPVNGKVADPIAIKGKADRGELQQHLSYRFYGHWSDYKNPRTGKTERQFAFKTFVQSQPHGRAGVITYLKKAGEGNGIGQSRATKLWDLFGSDAVRILREQPEVVAAAVKGLSIEDARAASAWLTEKQSLEDCTIELTSVLEGKGFPKDTPSRALKIWGNKAAETIKADPYKLMHFRGCGFKRCDSLYLELGLDPARLRRQAFCAWYAIASNTEGHTWFPAQVAADGVKAMVGGAEAKPAKAIKMARRIGRLNKDTHGALAVIREAGGAIVEAGTNVYLAEGRKAWCEAKVASIVADRMTDIPKRKPEIRDLPYQGYSVSTDGKVYSCRSNGGKLLDSCHELKPDEIKGGYLRVRIRTSDATYDSFQVSHLILGTFVGARPNGCVACHWDGNPKNNSLDNLRWDTRTANEDDKKRHGTHQTGSGNPAAKLNEEQVIELRQMYESGNFSTYKLSDIFGISRPVVCKIVRGELWTHV